jgi:hypothetical protein
MGKNNKILSEQPAAGAGTALAAPPAPASPKAPPPEMRMLSDIERAEAKALLLEKQLMEARKATLLAQQETIRLEKQVVALREENLNLRATGHNAEAARTDKERVDWLAAHGVQKDDKADLLADRLLIQRGAAAKA